MISIDAAQIKKLKAAIEGTSRKYKRELVTAINATARKSKSIINKEIRTELATTAKAVGSTISITRKASTGQLGATVTVRKTARLSLREFGARQTKAGVSAKISKNRGRHVVPGGFQGPKPGVMKASWRGHAFKRVGKQRLPIQKLRGPSPWGVFVIGKRKRPSVKLVETELKKQIERRIRFINLKNAGTI